MNITRVDVALVVLFIVVLAWCARKFDQRQRRAWRRRIVLEKLTALQQRRDAWTRSDGDGIQPVRHRFDGKRSA